MTLYLDAGTTYSKIISKKGITSIAGDAIVRGVWTHAAVDFLNENGMKDVIDKREVMGPLTTWLYAHCPSKQSVLRYPFWGALRILKSLKVNW